jgi:hypothetical protein
MQELNKMIQKMIYESLNEASSHSRGHSMVYAKKALNTAPGDFSFALPKSSKSDYKDSAVNLMKQLGINKEIEESDDMKKIAAAIKKALSSSVMGEAFTLLNAGSNSIAIKSNILTIYGVKFIQLFLIGAINSNFLKLSKNVTIDLQNKNASVIQISMG